MILPNVLTIQIQTTRETIERVVLYRNISYRVDRAPLGRAVKVTGEIRESSIENGHMRVTQLRRLNDGVARTLDLEDDETPTFNAKLTDPEYELAVGDWFNTGRCYVPYSMTFLEVA